MNFFATTTISLDLLQILKTKKVNKSIKEEMFSAPCYCVSNFRKLQHTKVLFTGFQRTKYLPTLTYACRNEGSSKKRNFNSIWQHEFSSALICNVQNDFMVEKSHFMTHTQFRRRVKVKKVFRERKSRHTALLQIPSSWPLEAFAFMCIRNISYCLWATNAWLI